MLVELAVAVGAAGAVGALTRPILVRLPEPRPDSEDPRHDVDLARKPLYVELARPGVVALVTGTALVGALGVTLTQPVRSWPCWLVVATLGVLLAVVDGATTWLPALLTRAGWVLSAAAALAGWWLGGSVSDLVRTLAGALVAGAFFAAFWWLSRGGIAFGDVRLVPVIGAAGAAGSWSLLVGVVLAGTVVAAGFGLWSTRRGCGPAFAYAPGLVTGALAGAPLAALLTGAV